jgi:hypothetical protein
MELTPDFIREQIPYYLTTGQKDGLIKALKDFPIKTNYYGNTGQGGLLQGDGWTKLQLRRFENGEKESVLGIVLSNTCDVASENKRDFPINITFAPLIPLSKYISLLGQAGVNSSHIQDKVTSIKDQKVTSIFFLPAGSELQEDHMALLDQLYTMPVKVFELETAKFRRFTLSLIGFYIFVFKLSVHFCRFHENVART